MPIIEKTTEYSLETIDLSVMQDSMEMSQADHAFSTHVSAEFRLADTHGLQQLKTASIGAHNSAQATRSYFVTTDAVSSGFRAYSKTYLYNVCESVGDS